MFPAAREPRGALVYLHGIQSHGGWYVDTAQEVARRGYSMYLTDRRGSGESTEPRGYFENKEQLVGDVREFVDLARDEHPGLPVFLVGGCWGARPAVTFAVESQDRIAGLVLISPALAAKVDLTVPEKLKVIVGGTVRPRSKVRIPLSPELFTRNPQWLEFIREDPLVLHEVATSFFLKQALWDKWIAKQTGLRLPAPAPAVRTRRDRGRPQGARLVRQPGLEDKRYVLYPEFDHLLDFEEERGRYWDDLVGWLDEHAAVRTAEARQGATA